MGDFIKKSLQFDRAKGALRVSARVANLSRRPVLNTSRRDARQVFALLSQWKNVIALDTYPITVIYV